MDVNNNRLQTDQGIFNITIAEWCKIIPTEIKALFFDQVMTLAGANFASTGVIRTENMAEIAVAVATNGQVVQLPGYDVLAAMGERIQVKTGGSRENKRKRPPPWAGDTCHINLKKINQLADLFLFTVSLNKLDGSTQVVHYLIPRFALMNRKGKFPSCIDFDYAQGGVVDTRDKWFPYMFKDYNELAERVAAVPTYTIVDIETW